MTESQWRTAREFFVGQLKRDQHVEDAEEAFADVSARLRLRHRSWEWFYQLRLTQRRLAKEHKRAGQPKGPRPGKRKDGSIRPAGSDRRLIGSLDQLQAYVDREAGDGAEYWMLFYH